MLISSSLHLTFYIWIQVIKGLFMELGSIIFLAVGIYFLGSKVELCNQLLLVALIW
jgi:hypothetical protein